MLNLEHFCKSVVNVLLLIQGKCPNYLEKVIKDPSMDRTHSYDHVICVDSDPDKHYLMYEHERVPIAVCEREPSSIIAFALR